MIHQDTIKLLRECDSGIKMGVSTINEVLPHTYSGTLRELLSKCRYEHEELDRELRSLLSEYADKGKSPNPLVKGMSFIKTEGALLMTEGDSTIARIMTDGCNMGIKSLSKYLNEYRAADERSKTIAKRLIDSEDRLAKNIRIYL